MKYLPLSQVRPYELALRAVNKDLEDYKELVDSIQTVGIINPIIVREIKDKETGNIIYGLIDGLYRYIAAIDAGLDSIPVHIIEADDVTTLDRQIICNSHTIKTKPAEYSRQLYRLLALKPTLVMSELCNRIQQSPTFITERFNLNKLTDEIRILVNNDSINLTNAFHLTALPQEEQIKFISQAVTMTPAEFVPRVLAKAKELIDNGEMKEIDIYDFS